MAINVILSEVKQSENRFPILMEHKLTGLIVLMLSSSNGSGVGIAMNAIDGYKLCHYSTNWLTASFSEYNKPITIQNL